MTKTKTKVLDGKLFVVFPAVREGKKEIIGPPRTELWHDHKTVVVRVRQETFVLDVIEALPPREEEVGVWVVVRQGFVVEVAGERAALEYEVGRRLTPAALAAKTAEQSADAVDPAERKMIWDGALRAIRAQVCDLGKWKVVAETIPFSRHNKLWMREDRRRAALYKMVGGLFGVSTRTFGWVGLANLSAEEVEAVRLTLWAICEELRVARKAEWLAAHPVNPS